jgi:hypothetical protein
MKFHDIDSYDFDALGPILVERVLWLPTFNALTDEGRIIYSTGAQTFWYGSDHHWNEITDQTTTQTLYNKTLITPTIASFINAQHDHTTAAKGGVIFQQNVKVWFYLNVAPTGWTIDPSVADTIIAVKGGSGTYKANGGTQAGTWSQPTHVHTGPSHTHTIATHTHTIASHAHTGPNHTHTIGTHTHSFTGVDHLHNTGNHTLTVAEMPIHSHAEQKLFWVYPNPTGNVGYGDKYHLIISDVTGTAGGDQAHNHGYTAGADRSLASTTGGSGTLTSNASGTANTGGTALTTDGSGTLTSSSSGTANTGSSATANTWRPLAALGIICTKD